MGADLVRVTQEQFKAEVLDSEIPVLVDFWAIWCGPCKALSPLVARIGQEYAGRLKVRQLDVDKAPQIAMNYGIRSIPTLLIFKNGQVAGQLVGAVPYAKLKKFVDSAL